MNFKNINASRVNNSPLVSIGCFTFNHEKFVGQAIEGFLMQQTNFQFEIIIHDDASTDGTREIIKSYQKKYPEIIFPLFQNENQWSKGVRMLLAKFVLPNARGKYLAFCEGDDFWIDPKKLQQQVDFLEASPDYSMCFHNAIIHYENSQNINRPFAEIADREYTGKELLAEWNVPTASIVFRIDSYRPLYNPNILFGDTALILTLAQWGKIYGKSETMSVYRKHAGGMSSNWDSIFSEAEIIKHYTERHKTFKEFASYKSKRSISRMYLAIAWRQLKRFSFSFVYYLLLSIKWSPIGFLQNVFLILQKKFCKVVTPVRNIRR